jgi:hypothetical protein
VIDRFSCGYCKCYGLGRGSSKGLPGKVVTVGHCFPSFFARSSPPGSTTSVSHPSSRHEELFQCSCNDLLPIYLHDTLKHVLRFYGGMSKEAMNVAFNHLHAPSKLCFWRTLPPFFHVTSTVTISPLNHFMSLLRPSCIRPRVPIFQYNLYPLS